MPGILDHSSNTIIMDAVLTTRGRQLLSRFDGSFQITRFGLTDDEVQYNIIRQYGRIIGKEYIEKLTMVLEATTNPETACRHHLISANEQTLTALPTLKISGDQYDSATNTITFTTAKKALVSAVTVQQALLIGTTIPASLRDSVFEVKLFHRSSQILGAVTPIVQPNGIAVYRIFATGNNSYNGGVGNFNLAVSPAYQDVLNYLGEAGGSPGAPVNLKGSKSQARSYMKIRGMTSGATALVNLKFLVAGAL